MVITCTGCSMQMNAPDDAVGKMVKCPQCGTVMVVADGAVPPTVPVTVLEEVPGRDAPARLAPRAGEYEPAGSRQRDRRPYTEREREAPPERRGPPAGPPRRGRQQPGAGLQAGLGIAALGLAALGLLFVFLPAVGWKVGLPIAS